MTAALLCYAAAALLALGRRQTTDAMSAVLAVLGSVFGVLAALSSFALADIAARMTSYPWHVPGGEVIVAVDSLSAAFLLLIFVVAGLGTIHGLAYWRRSDHPETATKLRFFYNLMVVSLALVVTARHSMLFLVAWEVMAVSAFFLVATEDEIEETRRAAWVYLAAAHVGTLSLFAAFSLLRLHTGSFLIQGGIASGSTMSVVFLLALLGFGLKAGLAPLHFWLPPAHANAPSHVSALMSGVMLKAGIYGILRITSLVTSVPMWWSLLLGGTAAATAVTGIALALTQTDLKKALAYSSVENVGIICLGIALALAGRSSGNPLWIVLGISGAMFHVWSHSAFKALLFFGSGNVLHAVHTRNMDRMGGLFRRMPVTAISFLIGSLSAAGLPLFSGFVGEWLITLGLFHAIQSGAIVGWYLAFTAPVLALAAALALASFFRIVAVIFLGSARSSEASHAEESSRWMLAPLILLACVSVVMGLIPAAFAAPLAALVSNWAGISGNRVGEFLILPSPVFLLLVTIGTLGAVFLYFLTRQRTRIAVTWDCGYALPTARMQYTAGSLMEWFSRRVLPSAWRPSTKATSLGLLPSEARFASDSTDPFSSRFYEPLISRCAARFERLRRLQQGKLTLYLVYIFVTLICGVAWAIFRGYVR